MCVREREREEENMHLWGCVCAAQGWEEFRECVRGAVGGTAEPAKVPQILDYRT